MIQNILRHITARYDRALRFFIANGLFALFIHALYRIRAYRQIDSLYPEVVPGFLDYCALSLHYDSITIAALLMALLIIIMAIGDAHRTACAILSLLQSIFVLFMLFALQFIRIYETTFQKSYAGREHFTDLGNIAGSALSEFSAEFYILSLLLFVMAAGMNLTLYYLPSPETISRVFRTITAPIRIRLMRASPPAMILPFLIAALLTDSTVPGSFVEGRSKDEAPTLLSMLHEFSMNPFLNLFSTSTPSGIDQSPTRPGAFSWRYNTDSIASPRRQARLEVVPRNKRYNIILYFFESMPAMYYDIEVKGRPVVPSWHRLERNSLFFKNHYCNYPLSANALLSVFTSAYGLYSKDMAIQKHPDIPLHTMPELLKTHGYRTCLIHTGGLGYSGQNRFLKNRKFDRILDYNQLIKVPPYNMQVGWGVDERAMIRPSLDFILEKRDGPFFLVLMPVNPHHPYAIPGDEFRITGSLPEGADYKKRNWHNYLNSLHYADASLGMLVDELERRGVMDDTLLFLFADHGEAFYQHRMNYNHPLFLYNENVHVPFMIYNRRIFPDPIGYEGITRHIDLLPTILDLLEIPRDARQEGLPILAPRRNQFALLHTSWKDDFLGVADGRWKYICRMKDMMEELYDLRNDPKERINIASTHPEITKRYRDVVLRAKQHQEEYYRRILGK